MDKGDIAIAISGLSALGAWVAASYTRTMAKNDSQRMKRKPPILELKRFTEPKAPAGWIGYEITMRNLEPVSVTISGLIARNRRGALIYSPDIEAAQTGQHGSAVTSFENIVGARSASLQIQLGPFGTKRQNRLDMITPDTARIIIYAKGIERASDIRLLWEWADGHSD